VKENFSKEQIANSLRLFKSRRDDLLHEDVAAFDHHIQRFTEFCRSDPLIQLVLKPLQDRFSVNIEEWWQKNLNNDGAIAFPNDPDEEFVLRYGVIENVCKESRYLLQFGFEQGLRNQDDIVALFRTVVIRPFADELSYRLGKAADMASPEARELQAVPLSRIPTRKEAKIFLSHKSVDKPLVYRYYHALKQAGFDPWLDEPNMAAGANLERELFRGFQESCAAVFFITESFEDKRYLASEVDYAIMQKRAKEKKFSIITLRYSNAAPVPDLLTPYIYKNIENDLQGFYELLRALPLELGPARWKADVIA
jgi:hypothetical protein